ncbi:MAG: DNA cytosine methyltransferase, partial [Candidatus Atribacteria bacterium]|nr:DNA cytosine methyltransferase [Candidatus Atribacteria bacterium]
HDYEPQQVLVRACDFGVPQYRPRYLTVGIRRDLFAGRQAPNFLDTLMAIRNDFLLARGLPTDHPVNVAQAISDLRVAGKTQITCDDPESPGGFRQISYVGPESDYQRLMHGSLNGHPINSLRLPNHRPSTVAKFERILATCRKGVQLSAADRERLGIKKSAIVPLAPDQPSHTLTTLPDDLLHYNEPRIHTIREHARLQSFPDWFDFRGKYTTGGDRRTRECPRYTQVGNAVPPLLAEAVGLAIQRLIADLHRDSSTTEPAKGG